jgi:hypothetical protein
MESGVLISTYTMMGVRKKRSKESSEIISQIEKVEWGLIDPLI